MVCWLEFAESALQINHMFEACCDKPPPSILTRKKMQKVRTLHVYYVDLANVQPSQE